MYFPLGWPRILRLPAQEPPASVVASEASEEAAASATSSESAAAAEKDEEVELKQVLCNRDKILTAILTANTLQIWYVKVSPNRIKKEEEEVR